MPSRTPIDTTYTLTANPKTIVRDVDGAFIPDDPANLDYAEYLRWKKAGGKATPYTPPPKAKAKSHG